MNLYFLFLLLFRTQSIWHQLIKFLASYYVTRLFFSFYCSVKISTERFRLYLCKSVVVMTGEGVQILQVSCYFVHDFWVRVFVLVVHFFILIYLFIE